MGYPWGVRGRGGWGVESGETSRRYVWERECTVSGIRGLGRVARVELAATDGGDGLGSREPRRDAPQYGLLAARPTSTS